ncbi:FIG000605: protein co-occurring with transport systems (COG1739) [hydrothermal vent metagenome]|uniref:FIG000605: protein co-occurring with transport systems (COG1739) n=1 Tax=hydrothermal vent metagenome TaxID=652676 RepID=A0A3B0TS53_9ZZZZ
MKKATDTYRTLSKPSEEILFKEKKSKFFGQAFPIENEDAVKPIVETLRKKYPGAGHVCYAWQLGVKNVAYRANDDREPNNSAGMPIYGQIQSYEVTNILVTVTRIFGGTKLGVGGLISAYRTAAQMALETSMVIEKIIQQQFQLSFQYADMNKVMRIIKQKQLKILSQEMNMDCRLLISVRQDFADQTEGCFQGINSISIKKVDS